MERFLPLALLPAVLLLAAPVRGEDGAEPAPESVLFPRPEPIDALDVLGLRRTPGWDGGGDFSPNVKSQTDGPLGTLTAQTVLRDPRPGHDNTVPDSDWKVDDAWKLEVAGPVFVFGQLGAVPDAISGEEVKVNARTGVGCKVPLLFGAEVAVQGGPALANPDALRPDRGRDQSSLFVEVQCRCPLPGQLGLEFQGTAVPGVGTATPNKFTQDVHLAVPVGDGGTLKLGAKRDWQDAPGAASRSWADGGQLYLGFEVGMFATRH
jgi:hypothetical protein